MRPTAPPADASAAHIELADELPDEASPEASEASEAPEAPLSPGTQARACARASALARLRASERRYLKLIVSVTALVLTTVTCGILAPSAREG
jgi:hypothetical protein